MESNQQIKITLSWNSARHQHKTDTIMFKIFSNTKSAEFKLNSIIIHRINLFVHVTCAPDDPPTSISGQLDNL